MDKKSLSLFADRVGEIWPAVMKEYMKHQAMDFHKIKITMPQCFVLEFLNRRGETKMTDVAKFLGVSTAALTQVAERLVRDGYVVRLQDPMDRRVIRIKLTAKGAKAIFGIMNRRKEMVMKMFSVVSAREREQYLRILDHIHRSLKEG